MDWDEEVVVITGGANGLGRVIAETYGMRGARVAVLDVDGPDQMEGEEGEEGLAGVKFYRCDIGNAEEVVDVAGRIQRDVCFYFFFFSFFFFFQCGFRIYFLF